VQHTRRRLQQCAHPVSIDGTYHGLTIYVGNGDISLIVLFPPRAHRVQGGQHLASMKGTPTKGKRNPNSSLSNLWFMPSGHHGGVKGGDETHVERIFGGRLDNRCWRLDARHPEKRRRNVRREHVTCSQEPCATVDKHSRNAPHATNSAARFYLKPSRLPTCNPAAP